MYFNDMGWAWVSHGNIPDSLERGVEYLISVAALLRYPAGMCNRRLYWPTNLF